jgi:CRP/FNR family transcriptional regulator, cyclic AMP receptor protein
MSGPAGRHDFDRHASGTGGSTAKAGSSGGGSSSDSNPRSSRATVPRMSPRHVPASVTELQRVGLFGSLPGETINKLAERMVREDVPPGHAIVTEGEYTDRFYVLLSGLAAVAQDGRGARAVIRPGETFGEVAPLMRMERTATVTAMTPCVVASCDRATFDELLRPLYVSD